MSGGGPEPWPGPGPGGTIQYREVQCMMSNGYMGTSPHPRGQIDINESITFPQLRWRMVKFEWDKDLIGH